METLDRRIPDQQSSEILWKKVPILSRPPLSGTGLRIDYNPSSNNNHHRRSCDLSGKQILMGDNDDVKTDVNRNVTNAEQTAKHNKVNSRSNNKKYHKKVGVNSFWRHHFNFKSAK